MTGVQTCALPICAPELFKNILKDSDEANLKIAMAAGKVRLSIAGEPALFECFYRAVFASAA